MIHQIADIHFAGISWIYALLLFVSALCLYGYYAYVTRQVLSNFAHSTRSVLIKGFSSSRRAVRAFFFVSGVAALCIALMRPCWDKTQETVSQKGRDLLIAIDVSRSMLAQDCKPNRLAYAKNKIRALVNRLPSDRIGLLIFAGTALVQCPLTTDHKAFFMFLDSLDAQTISSGTTALDEALKKSLTVFGSQEDKKTKLVVLFTDGEDFSSNLTGVKEQVLKQNVTMFAVGIGTTQGAPIPVLDGQGNQIDYEKEADGTVVMSRLNEGILKVLAHESGGHYVASTEDNTDIEQIVSGVKRFEQENIEDALITHWQERYMYFGWAALLLLLLEWVL